MTLYFQTVIDESMPRRYTLVISQYEKTATLHFTLRVYSTLPFSLKKIGDPYKFKKEFVGEWSVKNQTAGGCANNRDTYQNNPRFQIEAEKECLILVELKGPKQYQVNVGQCDLIRQFAAIQALFGKALMYLTRLQSGPPRS